MIRRLALALILPLVLAGSAFGHDGTHGRKHRIDAKIDRLQDRIAAADRREQVLTSEIASVSATIRGLQDDVARASTRLSALQGQLAAAEERLARLTEIYELQTRKLMLLRRQHGLAQRRLDQRLVEIYQTENPSTLEVVLAARSFTSALDQLDFLADIGAQDQSIARQVAAARREMARERERTERTRAGVQQAARAIEVRTEQQREVTTRLVSTREQLRDARAAKHQTLERVEEDKREFLHEVEGLQRASAALAAKIAAAQAAARRSAPSAASTGGSTSADGTPSARGMVWPVSGPLTSAFGWRWGRMHEGIDIGAPTGAPIQASASGTVIHSGWMSGYGNLVVIDHGGGLATAYAHMSSIGASAGQSVAQGQTIGFVGCTGNCFGSHLHFEVRVGGGAVDPLGYL